MGSQPCSMVPSVDEIFIINSYMENFFHTQKRLSAARKEANSFEEGSDAPSSFSSASAAQSWIRRVEAWISNLRRDLETDSLPAPGLVGERWLLYSFGGPLICSSTGAITCKLCKKCRDALFAVTTATSTHPRTQMPAMARANGLWRGPDPVEFERLSFAECKIINLARVYVCVKRIFLAVTATLAAPRKRRLYIIKKCSGLPSEPGRCAPSFRHVSTKPC